MTKLQGFTSVIKSAIRLSAMTLGLSALGIGQSWAGDAVAGQSKYSQSYTSTGGTQSCSTCHGTPSPTSNTLKIANGVSSMAIMVACNTGKMPCPINDPANSSSALTSDDYNNLATYIANAIGTPLSSATCIGGPCEVSVPVEVKFGLAKPGAPVTKTVTVTNSSSSPLRVLGTNLSQNTGDFIVAMGTCGGPIQPGGSCALNVTFAPANPTNVVTAVSDQLDIYTDLASSAAGAVNIVTLSGDSALALASLSWDNYPSVINAWSKSTYTLSAKLSNGGPDAVNLSNWVLSGDTGDFTKLRGSCITQSTLAAGAKCSVDLDFKSLSAGTTSTVTLKFTTNGQFHGSDLTFVGATRAEIMSPVGSGGAPAPNGGGCTIGRPDQPLDPLWLMMLGGAGLALYRRRRQQMH